MGTRSSTQIIDGEGRVLVSFYRQMDGYPSGLGNDIKRILNNGQAKLVNGYHMDQKIPEIFNGMGCLGAYLIGQLKGSDIGNIYIQPHDTQAYNYVIRELRPNPDMPGVIWFVVKDWQECDIYNGPLSEFDGLTVERASREE